MTEYDSRWYTCIYRANCRISNAVKNKDWDAFWTYLNMLDLLSPGQAAYARRYTHPFAGLLTGYGTLL